jgi:formate/nitrite transporter FocA (FNT family)
MDQDDDTEKERRDIDEHSSPSAKVVHTVVVEQGEEELARPLGSLFWSGIVAGIAMISSIWLSGALYAHLPAMPWRPLIVSLGYPLGFIIVVVGRLQLFTEQTMVAVLPFAKAPSWMNFRRVMRLWTTVFVGNVIGTAAVTALAVFAKVQPPEVLHGMVAVSANLPGKSPLEMLLLGIPAGFLIASVAWIRAATTDSGFPLIATITYAIAACGFTHVIAGAAEAWLLLWTGAVDIGWVGAGFLLPVMVGNIIGGTGLFAALAHAQAREEI